MSAAVDKVIAALEAHVRDTQAAILALQLAQRDAGEFVKKADPAPDAPPLCYVCGTRLRLRAVFCPDCQRIVCAHHRAAWRENRCGACLKKQPADRRSEAQEKRWNKAPLLTNDEAIRRGTHLLDIEAELDAGKPADVIAAKYSVSPGWVLALSKKPRLKPKGDQP